MNGKRQAKLNHLHKDLKFYFEQGKEEDTAICLHIYTYHLHVYISK